MLSPQRALITHSCCALTLSKPFLRPRPSCGRARNRAPKALYLLAQRRRGGHRNRRARTSSAMSVRLSPSGYAASSAAATTQADKRRLAFSARRARGRVRPAREATAARAS
jgi:hypothetical protein